MISSDRERYEEFLQERLNEDIGPVCDESEIAEFSRFRYDDFDSRVELIGVFKNEEIADYLLTFLSKDDVRQVLKNKMWYPYSSINPAFTLDMYFREISTVKMRNEILDRLVEIYSHSGQERLCRLTSRLRNHYLYNLPDGKWVDRD